VVVNGIAASSYISLQENGEEYVIMQGGFSVMSYQDFIHMALSPYRLFTMGVSSRMGNSYTEDGIPTFAAAGMDLAKWADGQSILVQVFLLVCFLVVAGASMVMENTFGPSMAPLAMLAGATAYGMMTKFNISIRANKIKSV
jgi:4-amino-4-deoxy-L-arabinose transferase-like glycosyltransferase